MSRLHIYTGNHTEHGRKTLSELIHIMSQGFAEVGTNVTFSDKYLLTDTQNILFEYFLPGHKDVLQSIKGEGIRIALFATEIPNRSKFGLRYSGFNQRKSEDWRYRFDAFEECIKFFDSIVTNVPLKSAQKYYKSYLPTDYIELGGYIRSLSSRKEIVANSSPGFYGLRTPYRSSRIQELDSSLDWPEFMTDSDVDIWLEQRKFVVSLKQHAGWQMQSPTRISRSLHAGRLILLEAVRAESPISKALGSYSKKDYQIEYLKLRDDFEYLMKRTEKQMYVHQDEHPAQRYFLDFAKNYSGNNTEEKFFVDFPLP